MRTFRSGVLGATVLSLVLLVSACGGESGEDASSPSPTDGTTDQPTSDDTGGTPGDDPTITVGSFNFPESVILAEIYAQALEDADYSVERQLDLGSRELVFPTMEAGEVDFLPEYVGSALSVGFGVEDVPTDPAEAVAQLEERFAEIGVTVLEPAPGEDKNVFVVTGDYAEQNSLTTISDLADVEGTVTLAGPPECESRSTCYAGLQEVYGLESLQFTPIQEGSARISSLENGNVQVALLFSTQPVIEQKGFVALEEDQPLVPTEAVIPVVNTEIIEAYGDEFVELINSISEQITTEVLLELNGRVELDAEDPEAVAQQWLEENGLLSG